jgi:hypothetical protein
MLHIASSMDFVCHAVSKVVSNLTLHICEKYLM